MMHREFLREFSAQERRSITAKSNHQATIRLSVLTALLTLTSAAIAASTAPNAQMHNNLWPILLPVQGLLIISLFHLLHECIHDTPFRTVLLNKVVGSLCGFILFIPCEWFRYFHRDHHRYTQIKGKDPELATDKPVTKTQWIFHVTGLPVYKSLLATNLKLSLTSTTETFIPAAARQAVVRQVRISVFLYGFLIVISVALGSTILLWIWLLPLVIGQPFLRLYLLAEHTLCEHSEDMFTNTRTVLSNPVVRWFTWNMPYHTEHHVYPAVPFHKLPDLHNKMQQFLANKDSGYAEFNKQLYRTLK